MGKQTALALIFRVGRLLFQVEVSSTIGATYMAQEGRENRATLKFTKGIRL